MVLKRTSHALYDVSVTVISLYQKCVEQLLVRGELVEPRMAALRQAQGERQLIDKLRANEFCSIYAKL